jgi:glycosyltransferase involved in cell wall biosynthesis
VTSDTPHDPEPRVSVALCTHNGARFVREQVESILAQSRPPFEIVLSDDASTDDTVGIVTALVEGSGIRLTVLANPVALGVTRNFEQAVAACTGDLVALCDQDDVWHERRLEVMTALFSERPGLLLAAGDARLVDERGVPLEHSLFEGLEISPAEFAGMRGGRAFATLLHRNLVTGATTVLRRSLAEAAVPFPEAWVHDEWLASVGAAIGEIALVPDRLVDYRQHGSNQIGVARLSPVGKLRRVLEPRAGRNARLVARAEALVARLEAPGVVVHPGVLDGARGKLAHERMRSSLPAARLARVLPVLREWRGRGYALYGRGTADAARDLLQPAT